MGSACEERLPVCMRMGATRGTAAADGATEHPLRFGAMMVSVGGRTLGTPDEAEEEEEEEGAGAAGMAINRAPFLAPLSPMDG